MREESKIKNDDMTYILIDSKISCETYNNIRPKGVVDEHG